jgi:hypothetical protein
VEPISFLDGISGYVRNSTNGSADKGIRLAVIDPAYDALGGTYPNAVNPARVTFEGETTLSGKSYPVATGFVPQPTARVWMVPIGNTWLIAGGAASYSAQGFYANASGAGVELGEGSYFDTDSGLQLLTDADIAGELNVDGKAFFGARGIVVPEIQVGGGTLVGPGAGSSITQTFTYPVPWPASTLVYIMTQQTGAAGVSAWSSLRTQNKTVTNFQVTALKTDAARANFDGTTSIPFDWVAIGIVP